MYSVKVCSGPGFNSVTRYLNFSSYTSATNCFYSIDARVETFYGPENYFEVATITKEPIGKLLNEKAAITDFVLSYLYKTID